MRTITSIVFFISLLFPSVCLGGGPFSQSHLRCGSGLISIRDPSIRVLQKCGEPDEKRKESVFSDLKFEKWIYGPREGYYYILTFWNDVLQKIQSYRW